MAFYSALFHKSEPSVLGIDIGSSAIKVVQIRKKHGQAQLETYGELALGPYGEASIGQSVVLPTERLAEALRDLLKEKEVGVSTDKCGVSIAFASSLMSLIEIPQVSEKQLAVMMPIEARKYIPVPISEVMLDWTIIPKNDSEDEEPATDAPPAQKKMDVLMVAIHNDTLARYKEVVSKAGLTPGFFEIEIFSTMRSVLDDTLQPVMIMDMGSASTKIYIIERGIIRSSHTVNRGGQDITTTISKSLGLPMDEAEILKREKGVMGDDKNLDEIIGLGLEHVFSEANRVLLSFEKKHNKAVSKTVLVGGGAALRGLAEIAKSNFKTEVEMGNPFGKLSAPAFLESILKATGPEFAVAIGLALRRLSEEA